MTRSNGVSGQIAPRRPIQWPDLTTLRCCSSLVFQARCAAPARGDPSAGPCNAQSPPRKLIGTYLASVLPFTAQCHAPARGGFMQTDPILMVRLLRQCNAAADTTEPLLHWLKQASLFCCQSQGQAVSAPLVNRLIAEFEPILQILTTLGGEPAQQAACQQLFSQICLFYRNLNHFCDHSGPLRQWQPPIAECAAKHGLSGAHPDKANPGKHGAQCYNRYD